jgi:hypothetical protein
MASEGAGAGDSDSQPSTNQASTEETPAASLATPPRPSPHTQGARLADAVDLKTQAAPHTPCTSRKAHSSTSLDPNGTAVHADGTSAAGTGISTVSSAPTVNLAISSGPGVWNVEDTAISILAATADVARVQEEINTVQHSTFAAHIAVERLAEEGIIHAHNLFVNR